MADQTLISDDIDRKSPYPAAIDTNSFVVRSIARLWNATMGCEQWTLLQQSKSNQTTDKRRCVIKEDSEIFKAIVAADPRVLDLKRDQVARDLLPTYRVVVTQRGMYCNIDKWEAMPIQRSEQARKDDRVHFDELDDLRKELGIGRADGDRLIRQCIGKNDWWVLAEQALRNKKTTPPAEPVSPYADGTVPDTAAAVAVMEAYEASQRTAPPVAPEPTTEQPKETTVLRDVNEAVDQMLNEEQLNGSIDYLPDDEPTKPAPIGITEAMIDDHELDPDKIGFALPAHLEKTYGKGKGGLHARHIFGTRGFTGWYEDNRRDSRKAWRMVLQYELKNPPLPELKDDENKNAQEAPSLNDSGTGIAQPPSIATEAAPASVENQNEKGNPAMPESPIVVYPMQNGSIVYKGIRFSVTLRLGGTFDMALALMNEFAAHIEWIEPSCRVSAQPANVTQMQQSVPNVPRLPTTSATPALPPAQPVASGEADNRGRTPGMRGTTVVTGVERVKKNGKVTIELWAGGQYPEFPLRKDTEHAMIAALGVAVDGLETGERYPINWTVDWVVSSNRASGGTGNYYLNAVGIRDNGQALPLAS